MMSSTMAMRPRLRANVFFAPSRDGTGALCLHGERVIALRGTSTYPWLVRLAPFLDGRFTVGELVTHLPDERQEMARRLMATLVEAGLVRDTAPDLPHTLSDQELNTYAPEVAFVEAFANSPGYGFQRYRESRFLVIGSGNILVALVGGLLRSGVRQVVAALTGPTDPDALADQRAQAADRDPGQRVDWRSLGAGAPLEQVIADADVVLHACEVASTARAQAVDRACLAAGNILVQSFVAGNEAWVGPVCRPDGSRWEDFWHRLRTAEGGTHEASTEFLTGPVPGIVANHTVFAGFEYLTGVVAPDAPAQVVRVDLETLHTAVHRVVARRRAPDDAAGSQAGCLTLVRQLAAGVEVTAAALAERVAAISDHRIGVMTPVAASPHDQFPLRIEEATVSAPGGRVKVTAAALDVDEARTRTRLAALATYAALADNGPAHGVSLMDGSVRAIPRIARPDRRAGVAAALSWAAAVEAGLLDRGLRLAVDRALESGRPASRIEPASMARDELTDHYLTLLGIAGQDVTVDDVTVLSSVPTFAFRLGGVPVAYRAGITAAEAMRDGLRAVLQMYQARSVGQLDLAPAPVAVDQHLPSPASEERRMTLVRALLATGQVPVVVPLGRDLAAREALPYVLRVVLLDA